MIKKLPLDTAAEMTENTDIANRLEEQPDDAKPVAVDAAPSTKVKLEKIDLEVEAKLRDLGSTIKFENGNTGNVTENDASNSNSYDASLDDKKQIKPVKSSNDLLAELFSVFNAAPPEELLDDKNLLRKHKKNGGKEKSKRSRSKPVKSEGECTDSDTAFSEGKHKHKHKRKKHKHKHKDSKDKLKDKDRVKSTEQTIALIEMPESRKRSAPIEDQAEVTSIKQESLKIEQGGERESEREKNREHEKERGREKNRDRGKNRDREKDKESGIEKEHEKYREREKDREREKRRERDKDRERERERDREQERNHNSFYHSSQESAQTRSKDCNSRLNKSKPGRRQSDDLSLSDEETYLREKANGRRRFYGGDEHPRQETGDIRRHNRYNKNSRHRTRSRSRSRSPQRNLGIDKKRLLEIARRNAINMFKRGNMVGVADMPPEVKDKVLLKMRYGGRSVQDLTEFCKKISNGELLSDLSSNEESDVDKNGNAKAFNHPFQLKEREPIVMHIRNSTPVVPVIRQEDQTKAITMQFPVSSGQVHRMSEVWVPVNPKDPLSPLPVLPPAKQITNIFKDVQRNVFHKSLPHEKQQEPAFRAAQTNNVASTTTSNEVASSSPNQLTVLSSENVPLPLTSESVVTQIEPPATFVPEVAIPSTVVSQSPPRPPPSTSIFPQTAPPSMDVSSIITQRLSAIRRLQDNPTDSEAIKMMYNAQRDMSSWASSKFLPGQFTGSTGAHIMKVHELSSGPQLWARKDQLTSTKPVTGGMGMTLLQKMGWKPGEGLGPSKTGTLQPLQLTVKLDKRGLVSREDVKQQSPRPVTTKPAQASRVNIATTVHIPQDKHPVCVLNELSSKKKWRAPLYKLKQESGSSNSRMFLFSVELNGKTYTPDQACNNKKNAKLNAAKLCLVDLGILPHV